MKQDACDALRAWCGRELGWDPFYCCVGGSAPAVVHGSFDNSEPRALWSGLTRRVILLKLGVQNPCVPPPPPLSFAI